MITSRKNLIETKQLYISCIVPVFNEQSNITKFIKILEQELIKLTDKFEIIIVDDGSKDNTLENAESLVNDKIKILGLSRNFGKENALTAGLEYAKGDVAILIDADFQHPFAVLPKFLERWAEGYDMVYGVRKNRKNETLLKRIFTKCFYMLLKSSNTNIPPDAGDFRLLDRKVIDAINSMDERNRFMKGIYAWVGFKSIAVPFDVAKRAAGKSTLNFSRLSELALTGITSFSNIPLRIWSLIGVAISFIAFIYGSYIVIKTLLFGVDVPGYATIVVTIMFFGGVQLLSVGILGEYLARIFEEVKHRPKYIIDKKIGF